VNIAAGWLHYSFSNRRSLIEHYAFTIVCSRYDCNSSGRWQRKFSMDEDETLNELEILEPTF